MAHSPPLVNGEGSQNNRPGKVTCISASQSHTHSSVITHHSLSLSLMNSLKVATNDQLNSLQEYMSGARTPPFG